MLFFIRHEDTEYRVRIESKKDQIFVKFEDEPEAALDLVFHGNNCSFVQDKKVFYRTVVGRKDDYTVWRADGNVSLKVESEYRRIVDMLRGQSADSDNHVYAKMPGKILKILVAEGDEVTKDQTLIVMEAMKMENEIKAPSDGVIGSLSVSESQTVETGELLLEMALPEDA